MTSVGIRLQGNNWQDSSRNTDGQAATSHSWSWKECVCRLSSQTCDANCSEKSCAKTILVDVYSQGHSKRGYVCTQSSMTRTTAKKQLLNIMDIWPSRIVSNSVCSCNGAETTSGRQSGDLVVEFLTEERSFELLVITECDQISNVKEEIPTPDCCAASSTFKAPVRPFPFADPDYDILLLIVRDKPEAHRVLEQCTRPRGSPFAQRLHLGWIIIGEVCQAKVISHNL